MIGDAHYDAPGRSSLRRTALLLLIAFLAGLAAMAWLLSEWREGARLLGIERAPPVVRIAEPVPVQPQLGPAPAPADVPGRVQFLEQRIGRLEREQQVAAGNASRADRLLVAVAARRALDRGVSLGYLEGLLRDRFAANQRLAVAEVIRASRRPVTLERLRSELARLEGDLEAPPPSVGLAERIRAELGSLVTVRRAGTPSTVPTERLERAEAALEAGQVDVALAEVLRMPGQARARTWVADAGRYVAARRALDTIETAALLEPVPA